MSWPVPGTLMIEPTESENHVEIERFCDAMIMIRREIAEIEEGKYPRDDNVLVNAPHCLQDLISTTWNRPYSREKAAFPVESLRIKKFWPSVGRLNDAHGDLNFCSCI